jgi:hypothetical protein
MVDSIRFMPQKGAKPRTMTLKRGIVDKPGRLLALLFQSSGKPLLARGPTPYWRTAMCADCVPTPNGKSVAYRG